MAKASSAGRSRVPLSIEKLDCVGARDESDQLTSKGPNLPTSSAEVSSAPVKSSARSLKEDIQSAPCPKPAFQRRFRLSFIAGNSQLYLYHKYWLKNSLKYQKNCRYPHPIATYPGDPPRPICLWRFSGGNDVIRQSSKRIPRAFSSEVETGSREENASKQKNRARF
jgi:hypothetical protein